MSFFKEFKEDLSKAVSELLPDVDQGEEEEELMINTLDTEDAVSDEQMVNTLNLEEMAEEEFIDNEEIKKLIEGFVTENITVSDQSGGNTAIKGKTDADGGRREQEKTGVSAQDAESAEDNNVDTEFIHKIASGSHEQKHNTAAVSGEEEVTVITKGTTVNGSISADGPLVVMGTVLGDIECLGKLSVTGKVTGNSSAAEAVITTDRIEGNINSEGMVKISLGTVILGNITGTSCVIAGAVKGEIDINGPVIIDSTAIIKGNMKAKSIQINNGAVVEGFCSLSYSTVNMENIFE